MNIGNGITLGPSIMIWRIEQGWYDGHLRSLIKDYPQRKVRIAARKRWQKIGSNKRAQL